MGPTVQIQAQATNRSLVKPATARRRIAIDPQLLFWRRLIDSAVADAKRTHNGLPTHAAILSRIWLEEFRPCLQDRDEWERSFACACSWLSLDVDAERKRVLKLVDDALLRAYLDHVHAYSYQQRAAVLNCVGASTAINRQYVLPLISEEDYETVAGIDHPDPAAATNQLARLTAA